MCGYCNAGCQQGFKRSTLRTYLEDAHDAGTKFVVNCNVESITIQAGSATGVQAEVKTPNGPCKISVKARAVVVAAGGIGSPGLLLKSKIGGPQVGKNLRLHPAWIVTGVYDQPIEAWHGQIQSAASFDLANAVGENGFLVESLTLNPGTWASQSPFTDGQSTRDQLRKLPYFATWHGISHDHGSGEVYLDEDNREALRWSLNDPIDFQVAQRAHIELATMHRAAGAKEIFTFHWNELRWRAGEDFDEYIEALTNALAESYTGYSAHQMGSCRMGSDPASSVADGWGKLHDVKGVWIGDGSALPSAPGVNPMITIMALAERTAVALIKDLAAK
jgi:choline dehydrogenase-like flavoprotein